MENLKITITKSGEWFRLEASATDNEQARKRFQEVTGCYQAANGIVETRVSTTDPFQLLKDQMSLMSDINE